MKVKQMLIYDPAVRELHHYGQFGENVYYTIINVITLFSSGLVLAPFTAAFQSDKNYFYLSCNLVSEKEKEIFKKAQTKTIIVKTFLPHGPFSSCCGGLCHIT